MSGARIATSLVGSYPQPDWLIDREALNKRLPLRLRARELWRIDPQWLREAQDDAVIVGIADLEELRFLRAHTDRLVKPVSQVSIEAAQSDVGLDVLDELPDKTIILGVFALDRTEVETPEAIAERLSRALEHQAMVDGACRVSSR